MDLALSDDQQLQDSIHRFLSDRYGAEQRRQSAGAAEGWSRAVWQAIADLGWLAIAVPEECGGLGGGGTELCLLAQALGRALVVEPVLHVVLASRLAASLGAGGWVPQLIDGRRVAVVAHQEGARALSMAVETRAERDGSGWVLSGRKDFVLAGPGTDIGLVTARAGPDLGVVPGGDQVCVVSISGAACAILADCLSGEGVAIPSLDETTVAALRPLVPSYGMVRNPVGLTGQATNERASFGRVCDILLASPRVDSLVIYLGGYLLDAMAPALVEAASRAHRPEATIEGVVVQKMVMGGQAILVGVRRDKTFGPMMTVGLGEILTELYVDAAHRLLPVREEDAWAMLRELRSFPVLDGYRGLPRVDCQALVRLMTTLSDFTLRHEDDVAEVELNPVLVGPDGAMMVDALLLLRPGRFNQETNEGDRT